MLKLGQVLHKTFSDEGDFGFAEVVPYASGSCDVELWVRPISFWRHINLIYL